MENSQARSLIREAFTQPFDKGRFKYFIGNLLNDIDESKAARWTKRYVKDAFKPKVERFERLATYTDPNGEKLDILIIYLEKQSSLERARTSLRNFVADYMTTGHGQGKTAVLAAFVSPNESDWRFSFIKLDYEAAADESGNVTVTETLTPARRYSFLVGANEHSHTAQKQLLPLLEQDDTRPLLEAIEKTFDIEKVTKEFFQRYKDLFENVRDALNEIVEQNAAVRDEFEKKGIDTNDFAKKLLGQIVFLYFLQKKGWFGVERHARWGTGNKNYLRQLFNERETYYKRNDGSTKRNFFNDILEPLFYNTLAVERSNDYADRFDCKIPFLNGGLFEPLFGYDWVQTDILLSDSLFSNDQRTKDGDTGIGVLDVFDRYNFTVNEAEPLEKDVAVDPEMLGKVFENLLPENLRHKGGTYYTPRPIVNYMCQQSLINYLSTNLPDVPREHLEVFVRVGFAQAEFQAAEAHKDRPNHREKFLPATIGGNSKSIDKLLEEITVCDPAIGSGAFPVGMMQEIVRARLALAKLKNMPNRTAYELKRHAIQNSLYGVDIDPGAVEIAKLRLWLSLIVDEDDRERIQALPNLDYKIMQGNSLLDEFAGVKLLDEDLLAKAFVDRESQLAMINSRINELQDQFFELDRQGARNREMKQRFVNEIETLKRQKKQLIGGNGVGNSQASFQDLKSIARAKLTELKQLHREFFDTSSVSRKKTIRKRLEALEWEFMEATLKETGRAKELRELVRHRADNRRDYFLWKLHFLEVFQEKGGFDIVMGNPPYVSFGLRGNEAAKEDWAKAVRRLYPHSAEYKISLYALFIDRGVQLARLGGILTYIIPDSFLLGRYFSKLRAWLLQTSHLEEICMFEEDFWPSGVVGRPTILSLTRKNTDYPLTVRLFRTLSEFERAGGISYAYGQNKFDFVPHKRFRLFFSPTSLAFVEHNERDAVRLGSLARITTGVRSKIGQDKVVSNVALDPKWKKGIRSGGQVKPYCVDYNGHYINIDPDILWAGGWNAEIEENPKLMIRQTGDSLIAAIDLEGLYHLNNVHSLSIIDTRVSLEYICAVLNSRLMNRYYHLISLELGRPMAQTDIETLETLPIRIPATDAHETIRNLVFKITEGDSSAITLTEEAVERVYSLNAALRTYLRHDELY